MMPWQRLDVGGQPHDHGFMMQGSEVCVCGRGGVGGGRRGGKGGGAGEGMPGRMPACSSSVLGRGPAVPKHIGSQRLRCHAAICMTAGQQTTVCLQPCPAWDASGTLDPSSHDCVAADTGLAQLALQSDSPGIIPCYTPILSSPQALHAHLFVAPGLPLQIRTAFVTFDNKGKAEVTAGLKDMKASLSAPPGCLPACLPASFFAAGAAGSARQHACAP